MAIDLVDDTPVHGGKRGLLNQPFFFCFGDGGGGGDPSLRNKAWDQRHMKSVWGQGDRISYNFMSSLIRKHIGNKC